MKTCITCLKPKHNSKFGFRRKGLPDRETQCRACKYAYTKRWRAKNKQKVKRSRRLWRLKNRSKVLAAKVRYRKRHPERARAQVRAAHQKRGKIYKRRQYFSLMEERYGLTKKQIRDQLKQQNHRCAICGNKQKCGKRRRLYIDHDHATGKFRGLLCFSCNSLLGFAKDSIQVLQASIAYLKSN